MFAKIKAVITDIVDYLREGIYDDPYGVPLDLPFDESVARLSRKIMEEQRQLAQYRRVRKRLPRIAKQLEATARELKAITEQTE